MAATIATIKTSVPAVANSQPSQRKLVRGSDGVLHCVYLRSDGSRNQVYYAYSSDDGDNWTEEAITAPFFKQQYNEMKMIEYKKALQLLEKYLDVAPGEEPKLIPKKGK